MKPLPLWEMERIAGMSTREAQEEALQRIPEQRRTMVSHFLVMYYAKRLCEALPSNGHGEVLKLIPSHLSDDACALARSYVRAARMVAEDNKNQRAYKDDGG